MTDFTALHTTMEAAITKQHGDKKDFKLKSQKVGEKTAYFHASWTGAKTGKTQNRFICFTKNCHMEDGAYYQRRTAEDIEDVCQGEDNRYPCETLEDMWE